MPIYDFNSAKQNRENDNPSTSDEDYNGFNGGDGGGDDVLQRVKDLEAKVATLVTDVAIIKDKLATKEDIQSVKTELHKELNAQTWKIIAALVITVLLAVFSKYFIK
ncbi:hypothetical protein QU819_01530 [Enterobacter roggenkampii]|uniref:hypothetical protein n=1 Tax=Enterobacter roggenkampii TaxID=1812935 RepID=UPI0020061A18|nr:hypothetical protein [Enterobacter roggenkampii]MCK7367610.1 hypothetical protein [Enterobacter roggenkampii]MDM9074049.1 hypothetical protein [Enterobacter roggenkampii]